MPLLKLSEGHDTLQIPPDRLLPTKTDTQPAPNQDCFQLVSTGESAHIADTMPFFCVSLNRAPWDRNRLLRRPSEGLRMERAEWLQADRIPAREVRHWRASKGRARPWS